MEQAYIIGVDEAGRGPLAGPVAVGAVLFMPDFNWRRLWGVHDSKQSTEIAKEKWYAKLQKLSDEGALRFTVEFSSAQEIDTLGIVPAVAASLERAIRSLVSAAGIMPDDCEVLLDGALYAPKDFSHQQTIIRGDETERAISLASVAAKIARDRHMIALAGKYPRYGFDEHKGYGTKRHQEAIRRFGLCDIHRKSFCKSIISVV